ncbi:MAG: hypothetical protein KAR87_00960 [Candidatus Aenigmarchaeota archaeon]|nr:hypothetical protein [Candidatus Aenigmarchaeota archaeon]
MLADRLAVKTQSGLDNVVKKILELFDTNHTERHKSSSNKKNESNNPNHNGKLLYGRKLKGRKL